MTDECHGCRMRQKHIRDINDERIAVVEANKRLRELAAQMYAALEYASDAVPPVGDLVCDCPICGALQAYVKEGAK